jgi:DNA mismatch repair protein MutL
LGRASASGEKYPLLQKNKPSASSVSVASGVAPRPEKETMTPRDSLALLESLKAQKTPTPIPTVRDSEEQAPVYRFVGEAFDCYVMIEYEGDLLVIDKHAAHERVIFEDLKRTRARDGRVASQSLLLPLSPKLSTEELASAREHFDELSCVGFAYEIVGETVELSAIPDCISPSAAEELFVSMTAEIHSGEGNPALNEEIRREKALYQIACKAAIKGGRVYDRSVLDWLIGKLLSIPDITVCPHGRPVAYRLTKRELDRQFDRIK